MVFTKAVKLILCLSSLFLFQLAYGTDLKIFGSAQVDGYVGAIFLDKERVEAMLPQYSYPMVEENQLELKAVPGHLFPEKSDHPDDDSTSESLHPVMILVGRHDRLQIDYNPGLLEKIFFDDLGIFPDFSFGLLPFPKFISYKEVILSIPYVGLKESDQPFWYFVRLFLDSDAAIRAGRYYGYPKEKGELLYRSKSGMSVWNEWGQDVLWGDFYPNKPTEDFDPEGFERNLVDLKTVIDLPVISYVRDQNDEDWKPVCSQFYWDTENAELAPAQVRWTVYPALDRSLSDNVNQGVDFGMTSGLDLRPLGGLRLNMRWWLSYMYSCRD